MFLLNWCDTQELLGWRPKYSNHEDYPLKLIEQGLSKDQLGRLQLWYRTHCQVQLSRFLTALVGTNEASQRHFWVGLENRVSFRLRLNIKNFRSALKKRRLSDPTSNQLDGGGGLTGIRHQCILFGLICISPGVLRAARAENQQFQKKTKTHKIPL